MRRLSKTYIIELVKAGKKLSAKQELYYLTQVVGLSKKDARRILHINRYYSDKNLVD